MDTNSSLRVISVRKNGPCFKPSVPNHIFVSPAQTCRHSVYANRDTLVPSAQHISTACTTARVLCRGSGSEENNTPTKLVTSGGEGQRHGARVHSWGLLKGRRVLGLPYLRTQPSVCAWIAALQPLGKDCGQTWALGDHSLVMGRWLAGLLLHTQLSYTPNPPVFNGIFNKSDPRSCDVRRSCSAVLPNFKALLCTRCTSKSSAVPVNTWFSKSCSSWSLNFHKHPPLTRKSCLTTKSRGITCRAFSSTAVCH